MTDRWSLWAVDSNSGAKQQRLSPSSGSWRRVINGAGSGTHSFQLRARPKTISLDSWRTMWQDWTRPWARTLVVCWDDTPVYAGVIIGSVWDRKKGVLTVSHEEIRTIFSRRHAYGVDQYETGTLTVTGRSFVGAVRAIVLACAGPKSARWQLPIVYPADSAGSYSNTWHNYSFVLGEKMLADIQNLENGPDIDFHPQWSSSGALEWVLRVGNPRLTGGTFEWAADAAKTGLTGVTVTRDAKNQLTGVLTIGEGSEADIKWGRAPESGGSVIPYLDTSRPYTDIGDVAKLNSFAQAELATFREPTVQYAASVLASEYPGVLSLVPGSTLRVGFSADEFVDSGVKVMRLLGLSGDLSSSLTLEVQGV